MKEPLLSKIVTILKDAKDTDSATGQLNGFVSEVQKKIWAAGQDAIDSLSLSTGEPSFVNNNAKSLIQKNDVKEVKNCYERAFELLDLSTYDHKWGHKLKELLRFREFLGVLYSKETPDLKTNNDLFKVLLFWDKDTAKVKM